MSIGSIYARFWQNALYRDSFWALFGNAINKGGALLAGILIARWLGEATYGQYGMIKNTLLYLAVFSSFGLGFTVTKYVAQLRESDQSKLKTVINAATFMSILFSSVMAAFLLTFPQKIATFLEAPELVNTLRYTAFTVVFNSLTTTQIGVLAGLQQFQIMARNNVIIGIVTLLTSCLLTYYYGLDGAIIALMISNLCNCLINYISIRNFLIKIRAKSSYILKKVVKELLRFSCPIALQECSFAVTYWLGILLLVKMSNYSEMGLYSAAMQWAAAILFIPSVLQNVALSYLSKTSNDSSNHTNILKRLLTINFVTTFIPSVIIFVFSDFIVSMYGTGYNGLKLVLNISIFTTIIQCIVQVYIQEYIAMGQTWTLFAIRFIRDLLGLALFFLLVSIFKDHAAAYYCLSYLASNGFCMFCMALLYRVHLKKKPEFIV